VREQLWSTARPRPEVPPRARGAGDLGPAKAESPALGVRVSLARTTRTHVPFVSATVDVARDQEPSPQQAGTLSYLKSIATLFSSVPLGHPGEQQQRDSKFPSMTRMTLGNLLLICTPLPCSPHLAGASCADIVLLRQGRLARHATVATTEFIGQPLHPCQEKPLHPLIDKATADPDGGGNVGDRYPIGHE
jgi:hypothetical protein